MIRTISNIAKGIIPKPIHRALRVTHRNFVFSYRNSLFFRKTLEKTLSNPQLLLSDRDVITALTYVWGNEDWSASQDYLLAYIDHMAQTKLPILECGSVLTTILAGLIA